MLLIQSNSEDLTRVHNARGGRHHLDFLNVSLTLLYCYRLQNENYGCSGLVVISANLLVQTLLSIQTWFKDDLFVHEGFQTQET